MAKMTLNTLLSQALTLIQRGEAARALVALDGLPSRAQSDPNVLHVRGLAYKAQGKLTRAEESLRRAVDGAPKHAALLNNLANVLNEQGKREDAAKMYGRAVALQADFVDAHRNLGIVLGHLGEHEGALSALERALSLVPDDPRTLSALGATLNALERPREAEEVLRTLLRTSPKQAVALHHLGISLRLQERLEEATQALALAREAAPEQPETVHAAATLAFERGEHDVAQRAYEQAIALRPDFVEAHETLNELHWQRGLLDRYGESYAQVHREHGWRSPALAAAWVRCLVLANRADDALRVSEEADKVLGSHPQVLRWQARAHRLLGQESAVRQALERAVAALGPAGADRREAITLRQDLLEALLRGGELERADPLADELLALDPNDQLSWAWRGTLWRQLGDDRYHDLHRDYGYVRAWQLPTPPGYDSLESFLSAVTDTLLSMHQMVVRPLSQTLEHGTQTPGRLFHKADPVVRALRDAIACVVDEYVAELPADASHPLLRRRTARWRFSGSWSVRLQPDGFHVDHVHPAGWISSACYISLPPSVTASTVDASGPQGQHAGWIRFGRSSLALAERDSAERYIQPQSGLLVLFPSFTWHGTVPFPGSPEDFRMTAPFDAVPT